MAGISISQGGNSHGTAEKTPPSYLGATIIKRSMGRKPTPDGALERQKSRSRTPGGARKPTAVKKRLLYHSPWYCTDNFDHSISAEAINFEGLGIKEDSLVYRTDPI
ncbi:hypothetical protein DID88_005573 [Monilinia fructigena]|uniref:Uncharacterized protein n=1 Tax=Monilinia fructigena TaxID=38457 RepID=A0A395J0H9_9HELO|nr:hypothetical protein DID88_005573 [Monilinia fructigena]